MTISVLGINHTSANLELREQVVFSPDRVPQALQHLVGVADITEAAILSTCNRTEIYFSGSSEEISNRVLQWIADYHQLDLKQLMHCHYRYREQAALEHMMKVACGLDSMIIGEPQILGQMKSCYSLARKTGALGSTLHRAFQCVLSTAKQVRSETSIGENPVSVAYAAVTLAQQIFSDLSQRTTLLIGAGETIELVTRHLQEKGVKTIIVANRTLLRAQNLAGKFAGKAMTLADMPETLHCADIVISSTASQLPILGKGAVESALKKRKYKPMFMVDIAVPRDIERQVNDLDNIYLYTIDDLYHVIDENIKSRQSAATNAHKIITENLSQYQNESRARNAVSTIKAYRKQAELVRDQVLVKALQDLANGGQPEKIIEQVANTMMNKLLHTPTNNLKQAAAKDRDNLIQLSRELFSLDEQ